MAGCKITLTYCQLVGKAIFNVKSYYCKSML